jgi:hypothetical protein
MAEALMMARKKAAPKKAPVTTSTRSLAFRVNDEYAAWVERLAAANRSTLAGLFDQALSHYAVKIGFTEPAPERT